MIERMSTPDRLLATLLLAVCTVAAALYLERAVEGGPMWSTVAIQGAPAPDQYPFVSYAYRDPAGPVTSLRERDELIRSRGGEDLRGASWLETTAALLAGDDAPGDLVVRSDGEVRTAHGELAPTRRRWLRLGVSIVMTALAIATLIGGSGQPWARPFALGFACFGLTWIPFWGASGERSLLALGVYSLATTLYGPFGIRAGLQFPAEVAASGLAARLWPWVFVIKGLSVTRPHFGFPSQLDPMRPLFGLIDAALITVLVGLLVWNYSRSGAGGRRRLRWLALGATAGVFPQVAAALLIARLPALAPLQDAVAPLLLLVPAGLAMGLLAWDRIDVDRWVVPAATWGVCVIASALPVLWLAPQAAEHLAGFGLGPGWVVLGWLAATLALWPVQRRLRAPAEALLLPEQARLRSDMAALRRDLGRARSAGPMVELVAARLDLLLRPRWLDVWLEAGEAPVRVAVTGAGQPEGAPALDRVLERSGRRLGRLRVAPRRNGDGFGPAELAELEAVAAELATALAGLDARDFVRDVRRLSARAEAQERTRARSTRTSSTLSGRLSALDRAVGELSEHVDAPEVRNLAERVAHSSDSFGRMLGALVDVSRLDERRVAVEPSTFSMAPLLGELHRRFVEPARERGVSLRVHTSSVQVCTDPALFARMLADVVAFAVRRTPRGGRVAVGVRRCDGPRVAILDTGSVPVAPDGRERGEVRDQLAIARRLAELLGHRLELRTSADGVTQACVWIDGDPPQRGADDGSPGHVTQPDRALG